MLSVEKLTKRYGASKAIEDVSFEASPGEIVGIVGHNGSGKSTTMNIITGYLAATSGHVRLDGEDNVQCAKKVRRKIGYLPEVPSLYAELTVEEQLRFACDIRGIRNRKEAITLACASTDIEGVRRRLIGNLSKGYRQRVGLAQALVGNPPVLILDEPSSGLDPTQIVDMRRMIRALGREHLVLMSTHVLSEVSALCSRLVILNNGRVAADETPERLSERFRQRDLYEIQVDCPDEALMGALSEAGYRDAKLLGTQGGLARVRLIVEEPDAASRLAAVAKSAGGELRAFGPVMPELEAVFLSLTRDERYAARKKGGAEKEGVSG